MTPQQKPCPSISAAGNKIGPRATRHMVSAFRVLLRGPNVVNNPRFSQLITGEAHPFGNFALVVDPTDAHATQDALAPLVSCGAPAAMVMAGPTPELVADGILNSGFVLAGSMPAMAVDIDALAPTSLPAGYEFVQVNGHTQGVAWAEAFSDGYELPRPVGAEFGPSTPGREPITDPNVQFFAIVKDDKIVSTSLLYLSDGLAGIYAVATLPGERGKGLGAHATAEALRCARAQGYRVGVLQASEAGHSVYVRLGFADFGALPLYVRMPK